MERISPFPEISYDTTHCHVDWHLGHTVEGEPYYFRRVGKDLPFAYVFGPRPEADHTTYLECPPNEGPWLCEACDKFIAREGRHH